MRRCVLMLIILLGTIGSGREAYSQNETDSVNITHLQTQWDHLRSDIQSANVRFRVYYSVTPTGECDGQRLHELINRYELARSAMRVEEFLNEFSGSDKRMVPTRIHYQDGDRTRQEFGQSLYIEDSDYFMIRKDANRQIAAYYRGGSTIGIPRLEQIRKIPKSGYQPQRISRNGATATFQSDSVLQIQDQEVPVQTEYECDWNSGIPTRCRRWVQGRLLTETRVFNLTVFAGDVQFPECVMEINYSRDQEIPQVQQLALYVVDEARFNAEISDDLFVMSKPAGMTVLDYRFPDSVQDLGVANQDIGDVRQILPSTSPSMPTIVTTDWTMRRRLFFFINGVFLLSLSVWLWRRAIRTS